MKAIIIQDHDARALLDQLSLESMDGNRRDYATLEIEIRKVLDANLGPLEKLKLIEVGGKLGSLLSDPAGEIVKEIHRRFYYVVCRWLQEQGANVVR